MVEAASLFLGLLNPPLVLALSVPTNLDLNKKALTPICCKYIRQAFLALRGCEPAELLPVCPCIVYSGCEATAQAYILDYTGGQLISGVVPVLARCKVFGIN